MKEYLIAAMWCRPCPRINVKLKLNKVEVHNQIANSHRRSTTYLQTPFFGIIPVAFELFVVSAEPYSIGIVGFNVPLNTL